MNAVLAGVTFVASFARFKASMAVFSEERVSFCPWVLVAMVKVEWCNVRTAGIGPY